MFQHTPFTKLKCRPLKCWGEGVVGVIIIHTDFIRNSKYVYIYIYVCVCVFKYILGVSKNRVSPKS